MNTTDPGRNIFHEFSVDYDADEARRIQVMINFCAWRHMSGSKNCLPIDMSKVWKSPIRGQEITRSLRVSYISDSNTLINPGQGEDTNFDPRGFCVFYLTSDSLPSDRKRPNTILYSGADTEERHAHLLNVFLNDENANFQAFVHVNFKLLDLISRNTLNSGRFAFHFRAKRSNADDGWERLTEFLPDIQRIELDVRSNQVSQVHSLVDQNVNRYVLDSFRRGGGLLNSGNFVQLPKKPGYDWSYQTTIIDGQTLEDFVDASPVETIDADCKTPSIDKTLFESPYYGRGDTDRNLNRTAQNGRVFCQDTPSDFCPLNQDTPGIARYVRRHSQVQYVEKVSLMNNSTKDGFVNLSESKDGVDLRIVSPSFLVGIHEIDEYTEHNLCSIYWEAVGDVVCVCYKRDASAVDPSDTEEMRPSSSPTLNSSIELKKQPTNDLLTVNFRSLSSLINENTRQWALGISSLGQNVFAQMLPEVLSPLPPQYDVPSNAEETLLRLKYRAKGKELTNKMVYIDHNMLYVKCNLVRVENESPANPYYALIPANFYVPLSDAGSFIPITEKGIKLCDISECHNVNHSDKEDVCSFFSQNPWGMKRITPSTQAKAQAEQNEWANNLLQLQADSDHHWFSRPKTFDTSSGSIDFIGKFFASNGLLRRRFRQQIYDMSTETYEMAPDDASSLLSLFDFNADFLAMMNSSENGINKRPENERQPVLNYFFQTWEVPEETEEEEVNEEEVNEEDTLKVRVNKDYSGNFRPFLSTDLSTDLVVDPLGLTSSAKGELFYAHFHFIKRIRRGRKQAVTQEDEGSDEASPFCYLENLTLEHLQEAQLEVGLVLPRIFPLSYYVHAYEFFNVPALQNFQDEPSSATFSKASLYLLLLFNLFYIFLFSQDFDLGVFPQDVQENIEADIDNIIFCIEKNHCNPEEEPYPPNPEKVNEYVTLCFENIFLFPSPPNESESSAFGMEMRENGKLVSYSLLVDMKRFERTSRFISLPTSINAFELVFSKVDEEMSNSVFRRVDYAESLLSLSGERAREDATIQDVTMNLLQAFSNTNVKEILSRVRRVRGEGLNENNFITFLMREGLEWKTRLSPYIMFPQTLEEKTFIDGEEGLVAVTCPEKVVDNPVGPENTSDQARNTRAIFKTATPYTVYSCLFQNEYCLIDVGVGNIFQAIRSPSLTHQMHTTYEIIYDDEKSRSGFWEDGIVVHAPQFRHLRPIRIPFDKETAGRLVPYILREEESLFCELAFLSNSALDMTRCCDYLSLSSKNIVIINRVGTGYEVELSTADLWRRTGRLPDHVLANMVGNTFRPSTPYDRRFALNKNGDDEKFQGIVFLVFTADESDGADERISSDFRSIRSKTADGGPSNDLYFNVSLNADQGWIVTRVVGDKTLALAGRSWSDSNSSKGRSGSSAPWSASMICFDETGRTAYNCGWLRNQTGAEAQEEQLPHIAMGRPVVLDAHSKRVSIQTSPSKGDKALLFECLCMGRGKRSKDVRIELSDLLSDLSKGVSPMVCVSKNKLSKDTEDVTNHDTQTYVELVLQTSDAIYKSEAEGDVSFYHIWIAFSNHTHGHDGAGEDNCLDVNRMKSACTSAIERVCEPLWLRGEVQDSMKEHCRVENRNVDAKTISAKMLSSEDEGAFLRFDASGRMFVNNVLRECEQSLIRNEEGTILKVYPSPQDVVQVQTMRGIVHVQNPSLAFRASSKTMSECYAAFLRVAATGNR